ncbi:MAG: hypothetical protein ACYCSQ_05540 [bacterium]
MPQKELISGLISEIADKYRLEEWEVCYIYENAFRDYFKDAYSIHFGSGDKVIEVIKHSSGRDETIGIEKIHGNLPLLFEELTRKVEKRITVYKNINAEGLIRQYLHKNIRGAVIKKNDIAYEVSVLSGALTVYMPVYETYREFNEGDNIEGAVIKTGRIVTVISQKTNLFIKNIIKRELDLDVIVKFRKPGIFSKVISDIIPQAVFIGVAEKIAGEKLKFSQKSKKSPSKK